MTLVLHSCDEVNKILATLRLQVHKLHLQNIQPSLAVILVGQDPASQIYVRHKCDQALKTGIYAKCYYLPENACGNDILDTIDQLNRNRDVHGILVQLPLPSHLDTPQILQSVDPRKDVDGLHPHNMGLLMNQTPYLVACTPLSCLALIQKIYLDLKGLTATLIGTSRLIGKPLTHLLLNQNCTVRLTHIHTKNTKQECLDADIVVAAAGVHHMVKSDWIKPGAVVIDVGIHRIQNTDGSSYLQGDVDYQQVLSKACAVTPVPGGVGPLTVAYLLQNTVKATAHIHNIDLDSII